MLDIDEEVLLELEFHMKKARQQKTCSERFELSPGLPDHLSKVAP